MQRPTACASCCSPKIAILGETERRDAQTHTGIVLSTPESAGASRGQQPAVGPACHTYAAVHEMLTGRPPITAATAVETLLKVRNEIPVPIGRLQPRVPRDLQIIAHKCLEKEPNRRYATTRDLADDLWRYLNDLPIQGRPPSLLYQWRQVARRHRAMVGAAAAVLVALATGTIVSVIFALGEAQQRRQADANASKATALATAVDDARAALRQATGPVGERSRRVIQGDFIQAAAQLDAAPLELRGWEWLVLHARLSDHQPTQTFLSKKYGSVDFFPAVPLVRANDKGRLLIVDAKNGTVVHDWPAGYLVCVGGKVYLARYKAGSAITLLDSAGQERQIGPILGPGLEDFVLSPDGSRLAAWWPLGKDNRRVACYDVGSGRALLDSTNVWLVCSPVFSPDSSLLAQPGPQHAVTVWLTKTGELRELKGHTARITRLTFSPDGNELASSSEDGTVRQWNIRTGTTRHIRHAQRSFVVTLAYSPDGLWLAAGHSDRTISVWPADGSDPAVVLRLGSDDIRHVGFSPDGATLGIVNAAGMVYLMPTPSLADANVLLGHGRYVHAVAVSRDARWIASGGWESSGGGTARFWDARTGIAIPEMTASFPDYVGALAFTPSGEHLVA